MTARQAKPFHSPNHPYSPDGGKVMLYKGHKGVTFEEKEVADKLKEGWKDHPHDAEEAEKPRRGRPPKAETEE